MKISLQSNKGFTLIEILIVMLISSVVIGAVYSAYQSNLSAYITQQRVVYMQQNIRAVVFYMTRDIQMAGYDPDEGKANAGIIDARADSITFSMDLNQSGTLDAGETVVYTLNGSDLERNGIVVCADMNALDFVYLDGDGNILPDGDGDGVVDDMAHIISVQISVLLQDGDTISPLAHTFVNDRIYTNQQGTLLKDYSAAPDEFRRRLYSTTIKCRNLGL